MKASKRFQQIPSAGSPPAKKVALLRATAYSKAALALEKAGIPPSLPLPPHPGGPGLVFPENPPMPWEYRWFPLWGWVRLTSLPCPNEDQCEFWGKFDVHFPYPLRARPRKEGGILLSERSGMQCYDSWIKRLWWENGVLRFQDSYAFDSNRPSRFSDWAFGPLLNPPPLF